VGSLSKTQVDRLGDRFRKGKIAEGDFHELDAYRRSFAEAYEEILAIVRNATQLEPTGRPAKSTTSIIEKLRRETIRLSQMQDIAGCRLVVPNVLVQNQLVERLKSALPRAVVVDRRKQPSFGYRAVHIIATARNKPIEIQLRTEFQHLWAQLSEKLSDVRDPAIKYGGGDAEVQRFLSSSSTTIASLEELDLRLSEPVLSEHPRLQPLVAQATGRLAEVNRNLRRLLEEAIKSGGGN
jgi:ppGpp synthetase/RelA/SpoT-type nucleotidyltranferase